MMAELEPLPRRRNNWRVIGETVSETLTGVKCHKQRSHGCDEKRLDTSRHCCFALSGA